MAGRVEIEQEAAAAAAALEKEKTTAMAEEWKQRGNKLYKNGDWPTAIESYSNALDAISKTLDARATVSDLACACLNNRAACYAAMNQHTKVIPDVDLVIKTQPANIKALLRRMVAYDAMNEMNKALEDAGSVLTMEPQNPHALEVVDRKRKGLTKKGNEELKNKADSAAPLAVFLFTENRPLQCYSCLLSLYKHMKNSRLDVHVFWAAPDRACKQSYQMLQCYRPTNRVPNGDISWSEATGEQLFPAFSRAANRLSVEGRQHVLILSDKVVFHSDFDVDAAVKMMWARQAKTHSVRLDMNARITYFPEADLISSTPALEAFAEDPRLLLWTRSFDKAKKAYEAVPREMGWDAILDWTASIVRTDHVQHFFSALMPPPTTLQEFDDRAADWLSRRQRMKHNEVLTKSACYEEPHLVAINPELLGDASQTDRALRAHLFDKFRSSQQQFADSLGWKLDEVKKYFQDADSKEPITVPMAGLLEPELFRGHYFDSVWVSPVPPTCNMPIELSPPAPLVSWLVAARNEEGFIWDCLESMDNQTGIEKGRYEIVVVDDASEDGTLALMRKFAESRPYVRIVENDAQMGVAGSICAGWPKCRGDFVARLDADDIATPDRLVKQLRYLEQHPTICLLGGKTQSFWTEERICTIEKVVEKSGDRLGLVCWREDHGNQCSRSREQVTIMRKGVEIVTEDGPAEYFGCRIVRIGEESTTLNPDNWKKAVKAAAGGVADVLLQRRDPLEQPRGANVFHPLLVRARIAFEDCISGTTATFRRSEFAKECPYQREECETSWCWACLGPQQHAANIGDVLVHTRRHANNRTPANHAGILESKYAAVQYLMTKTHGVDATMADAALHNFRGPCNAEQGKKLMQILEHIEKSYLHDYVRPQFSDEAAHGEFWKDFIQGREVALERSLVASRMIIQKLVDEVSDIITTVPEHSPRANREREPPR